MAAQRRAPTIYGLETLRAQSAPIERPHYE
jgi:hypothetical protein